MEIVRRSGRSPVKREAHIACCSAACTDCDVYPDPFVGDNLTKAPASIASSSWWYRTELTDWNPGPPDRDMGIWQNVYLQKSGAVAVRGTHVMTKVDPSLASAELTIKAD